MGTRADFYVGRGAEAEWLGSIAWDGYPDGVAKPILRAETEGAFRESVTAFLGQRDDGTTPDQGWPWPWDDSGTTDYSYAFDDAATHASCFGSGWWLAADEQPEDTDEVPGSAVFPDMSAAGCSAPAGSKRSGVMVFGVPKKP